MTDEEDNTESETEHEEEEPSTFFEAQKPEVDRENVIEYFWGMYNTRREPLAIEPYQNVLDAFADNNLAGRIDQDEVTIEVDVREGDDAYIVVDDAGGFTQSGWEHLKKIAASDKKDRSGAGSMGIGTWATAHLCEHLVIETRTPEGDHKAIVIFGGLHEDATDFYDANGTDEVEMLYAQFDAIDDGFNLPEGQYGTYFEASGVRDASMNTLTTPSEFEDILAYHFPVLASEKVSLNVRINGKRTEMSFPHLDDIVGEVFVDGETQTFTDNEFSETRELRHITVAEAAQTPPWNNGVALFKTHEFYDLPQMLVETYNPHVDGVKGSDPDMVAYAYADDLCGEPNLEDPSHQRFNVNFTDETELKTPVWEVWREHFANEPSAEEEQDKLDQIRDNVHEMFSLVGDDINDHISDELGGMMTVNKGGGESNERLLVCKPHLKEFDTHEVDVGFDIYCPAEPEHDQFLVRNAVISLQGGDWQTDLDDRFIDVKDDRILKNRETVEVPEDGFYVIEAELVKVPGWVKKPEEWQQSQTPDDTSRANFAVNDTFQTEPSERSSVSSPSDGDDGDNQKEGGIISKITSVTPSEPTKCLVYARHDPSSGGYVLDINRQHPDWLEYQGESETVRMREQTRIASERGFLSLLSSIESAELRNIIYEMDDKDKMEEEVMELKNNFREIRATVQTDSDVSEVFQ